MILEIVYLSFTLEVISRFPVSCYKNHSALSTIVFSDMDLPEDDVHSEYYFGKCGTYYKHLMQHDRWKYEQLKNRMIVRGWLDVDRAPTCVYVSSKSSYGDLIRYHAFKFNVCICTLVYSYSGTKYVYFYYEWFIPVEISKELEWDLYFYLS